MGNRCTGVDTPSDIDTLWSDARYLFVQIGDIYCDLSVLSMRFCLRVSATFSPVWISRIISAVDSQFPDSSSMIEGFSTYGSLNTRSTYWLKVILTVQFQSLRVHHLATPKLQPCFFDLGSKLLQIYLTFRIIHVCGNAWHVDFFVKLTRWMVSFCWWWWCRYFMSDDSIQVIPRMQN